MMAQYMYSIRELIDPAPTQKPCPNFAAWSTENLVNFANEARLRMYEQDQAIEQLRTDLRDAMRLVREKQDART